MDNNRAVTVHLGDGEFCFNPSYNWITIELIKDGKGFIYDGFNPSYNWITIEHSMGGFYQILKVLILLIIG